MGLHTDFRTVSASSKVTELGLYIYGMSNEEGEVGPLSVGGYLGRSKGIGMNEAGVNSGCGFLDGIEFLG
jgi:hypothetical protein